MKQIYRTGNTDCEQSIQCQDCDMLQTLLEKREETRRNRNSWENWVNRKASKQIEFDTEKRTQGGKKRKQEEMCKLTEVDNEI